MSNNEGPSDDRGSAIIARAIEATLGRESVSAAFLNDMPTDDELRSMRRVRRSIARRRFWRSITNMGAQAGAIRSELLASGLIPERRTVLVRTTGRTEWELDQDDAESVGVFATCTLASASDHLSISLVRSTPSDRSIAVLAMFDDGSIRIEPAEAIDDRLLRARFPSGEIAALLVAETLG